MTETKLCPSCDEIKPLDDFYMHRTGEGAGKPLSYCKLCKSKHGKAYRDANPEKIKARNERYRETHLDSINAGNKRYRETYPERIKANSKKYRDAYPERVRTRDKIYRIANPEMAILHNKKHMEKVRTELLNFFGWECEICEEPLVAFLTIDHIENDGAARKRKGEPRGWKGIWRVCRDAGWDASLRSIYRILCFNCNCSLGSRENPYLDWRVALGASKAQECLM